MGKQLDRPELAEARKPGIYGTRGRVLPFDYAKHADLAAAIAAAGELTDTEASQAQRESGNYRKGKVSLHGLTVAIENPRGSTRSGTSKSGKAWSISLR